MPHASNPQFLQAYFGVSLKGKALISHAAKHGWDYLRTHYYYFDKRAQALSLSRLEQACSKSQKVHCKLNQLRQVQGELNDRNPNASKERG